VRDMDKPLVFNYKKYKDLREAYKTLLADNNKLIADNRRLRKEITGLEIEIRVLRAYLVEERK